MNHGILELKKGISFANQISRQQGVIIQVSLSYVALTHIYSLSVVLTITKKS